MVSQPLLLTNITTSGDFAAASTPNVGQIPWIRRPFYFPIIDHCFIRKYRMSLQGICDQITGDFLEGVRAKLVDKDFTPHIKRDPPRRHD